MIKENNKFKIKVADKEFYQNEDITNLPDFKNFNVGFFPVSSDKVWQWNDIIDYVKIYRKD